MSSRHSHLAPMGPDTGQRSSAYRCQTMVLHLRHRCTRYMYLYGACGPRPAVRHPRHRTVVQLPRNRTLVWLPRHRTLVLCNECWTLVRCLWASDSGPVPGANQEFSLRAYNKSSLCLGTSAEPGGAQPTSNLQCSGNKHSIPSGIGARVSPGYIAHLQTPGFPLIPLITGVPRSPMGLP